MPARLPPLRSPDGPAAPPREGPGARRRRPPASDRPARVPARIAALLGPGESVTWFGHPDPDRTLRVAEVRRAGLVLAAMGSVLAIGFECAALQGGARTLLAIEPGLLRGLAGYLFFLGATLQATGVLVALLARAVRDAELRGIAYVVTSRRAFEVRGTRIVRAYPAQALVQARCVWLNHPLQAGPPRRFETSAASRVALLADGGHGTVVLGLEPAWPGLARLLPRAQRRLRAQGFLAIADAAAVTERVVALGHRLQARAPRAWREAA